MLNHLHIATGDMDYDVIYEVIVFWGCEVVDDVVLQSGVVTCVMRLYCILGSWCHDNVMTLKRGLSLR